MIHWIDVTMPLHEGMVTWPGDEPFTVYPDRRIPHGQGCNTSRLTLHTHTGTHVDAPWHFIDTGKRLDQLDASVFFGKAAVIEVRGEKRIEARHLRDKPLQPRVLLKTDNSFFPDDGVFRPDYTAIEPDAAELLVDAGVRLVGIDYLSIGSFKQTGRLTHHVLLKQDVLIVEGLRLAEVEPGEHWFVVLPLAVQGLDGAPCRAFVGKETR